jgi:hypothetical protein
MTRQGDAVQQEAKRRVNYLVEFVRSALPEGIEREQAESTTGRKSGAGAGDPKRVKSSSMSRKMGFSNWHRRLHR